MGGNAKRLQVVAGVLSDRHGRVLLTQRPPGSHLAGLWEFPGGKIEAGESARDALSRELREEIGVDVAAAQPLHRVAWDYPEKSLTIDAWRVSEFHGQPVGREGQQLRWVEIGQLHAQSMPAADVPLLWALRLPRTLAVSADPGDDDEAWLGALRRTLEAGQRFVYLRLRQLEQARAERLLTRSAALADAYAAHLVYGGTLGISALPRGIGLHLSTTQLMQTRVRPLPRGELLGASCHSLAQARRAQRLGCDYLTLSPVAATASHPDAPPLGWVRFAALAAQVAPPCFALGGMSMRDLEQARSHHAFGIAGIGSFWNAG